MRLRRSERRGRAVLQGVRHEAGACMTVRALWMVVVLLIAGIVSAAQMPDPKQMSGMPLPVSDIPIGTVTVRLIRGQLTNPLPGETVELTGSGMAPQTAKSDASGRAQFTGLTPG